VTGSVSLLDAPEQVAVNVDANVADDLGIGRLFE
jgi:hypothetical protein